MKLHYYNARQMEWKGNYSVYLLKQMFTLLHGSIHVSNED